MDRLLPKHLGKIYRIILRKIKEESLRFAPNYKELLQIKIKEKQKQQIKVSTETKATENHIII